VPFLLIEKDKKMATFSQAGEEAFFVVDKATNNPTNMLSTGIGFTTPEDSAKEMYIGGQAMQLDVLSSSDANTPPAPSVKHVLSVAVTDLTATFNVTPNCDGELDFMDGSDFFAWTATTVDKTHDYVAGTHSAKFTPTNSNDTGSVVMITTTDPAPPEPPPEVVLKSGKK